jgi:uncharacterized protein YjgD (DUF1641 family)
MAINNYGTSELAQRPPATGAGRPPALPQQRPVELQLAEIQQTLAEIQQELAEQRRRARELEELKEDLTRIAKEVLDSAVRELDEISPFVRTGDFTNLAKKLLRNTNRIAQGLDKLESAADFVRDATPISHDIFRAVITKLDEMERKGYFQVAADLQATTDALVRVLAKSRVLPAMRAALEAPHAPEHAEEGARFSLWRAYRSTKRPEMRRMLGAAMGLLGRFAAELDLRSGRPALEAAATPVAALQ